MRSTKYLFLFMFLKIFETKKGPKLKELLVATKGGSDQLAVVKDRVSGEMSELASVDCLETWERGLRLGEARLDTSAASQCARHRECRQEYQCTM